MKLSISSFKETTFKNPDTVIISLKILQGPFPHLLKLRQLIKQAEQRREENKGESVVNDSDENEFYSSLNSLSENKIWSNMPKISIFELADIFNSLGERLSKWKELSNENITLLLKVASLMVRKTDVEIYELLEDSKVKINIKFIFLGFV